MFQTGLLILTSPIHNLLTRMGLYLASAKQVVSKRLYIKLDPNYKNLWQQGKVPLSAVDSQLIFNLIPAIYCHASNACSDLDVRVLQTFAKTASSYEKHISSDLDVILIDDQLKSEDVGDYLKRQFDKACNNVHRLQLSDKLLAENDCGTKKENVCYTVNDDGPIRQYKRTILGGTFDRLHNGHKILLSTAALCTTQELVVGVTDGTMLHKKVLWELIEPIDNRMTALKEFLIDIDPTISYDIVPIYDPYGPSIVVPEYECIVVTDETLKGGHKVNEERIKRNMPELKIHCIPLLNDPWRNDPVEELKVSSSSIRMRLLGTVLKPPKPKPNLPSRPYIIGVTGGIASGKSAIVNHLQQLGAAVVDCDRLSHRSYEPDSRIYNTIVSEFGKDILAENGYINRKLLGAKVFGSEELRQKLNSIVWPEVSRMAEEEIQQYAWEGASIVVKEAALLLEAGWEDRVHQVWACIIPEKEAIKRIHERDSLSEEQALQRINSQMSNSERISKANVVFCSFWDPDYTKKQVTKAYKQLQEYLKLDSK